jgi:beta-glucosidase
MMQQYGSGVSRSAAVSVRRGLIALLLSSCTCAPVFASETAQPELEIRSKSLISIDGLRFKDLDANGALDPYEDWRLPADERARDLAARMTLDEKAGMMLIASHNPACDGSIAPAGRSLIEEQHMSRFVLRAKVVPDGPDCSVRLTGMAARQGYPQTPRQMAEFTNAVQELREATRLGIPALFKDNMRNHVETNPLFGIAVDAGSFSEFPKPAGLAAAALGAFSTPNASGSVPEDLRGDMEVIRSFASVMAIEWRAIGLRGMYGYTIDLGTEPRWSRFHETFSEDADLVADIAATLVEELQGPIQENGLALSDGTAVSMTLKHFPGGGPQLGGWDPHYTFGKSQIYPDPTGQYGFAYHLKPFKAAIDAGVASIMPYYGVPIDVEYDGEEYDEIGMAFSHQIVTGLLREKLGFKGNVNSDSGIIQTRGWGIEDDRINPATGQNYTIADRTAIAIQAGADVLSEFRDKDAIVDLVESGRLDEAKDIDPAVIRLLGEQFALGLFEDPYVDAELAERVLGSPAHRALGLDLQRRSVVLLRNQGGESSRGMLPVASGSKIYAIGFSVQDIAERGFSVIEGLPEDQRRMSVPADADLALVKITISNAGADTYRSSDPTLGGRRVESRFGLTNPRTGAPQGTWAEQDPCTFAGSIETECVDDALMFGGSFPWESSMLSLSAMARSESWKIEPSLDELKQIVREIGDPKKVVVSIDFRQPYVLDEESGILDMGAILATFGVRDEAQLDVVFGKSEPIGRLPFALPRTVQAVEEQAPDAPGYSETTDGELFPYGFGLGYEHFPRLEK